VAENNSDYVKRIENLIKKFLKLLNKELSLNLTEAICEEAIQFLKDILNSIENPFNNSKLDLFKWRIPIKRLEYLAAALLYFILNYKKNSTEIKISKYADILKLARQNIRRVMKYLASFEEILQKHSLTYTPRRTYNFDESSYINQVYSYITKFYNQLVKDLNKKVRVLSFSILISLCP